MDNIKPYEGTHTGEEIDNFLDIFGISYSQWDKAYSMALASDNWIADTNVTGMDVNNSCSWVSLHGKEVVNATKWVGTTGEELPALIEECDNRLTALEDLEQFKDLNEIKELTTHATAVSNASWQKVNSYESRVVEIYNAFQNGDLKGEQGVGIASVKPYKISFDDGGTSVYRITLTDGTTADFSVKNGNRGNSGYTGAADELEVVNNLSQGGETAALSAEMGKVLNQKIEEGNYEIIYEYDWERMTESEQAAYIQAHPNLVVLEGRDPEQGGTSASFSEGMLTLGDNSSFSEGMLYLDATFSNGILTLN